MIEYPLKRKECSCPSLRCSLCGKYQDNVFTTQKELILKLYMKSPLSEEDIELLENIKITYLYLKDSRGGM